ncbi:DUF3168 domain-containing protein [Halomonas sp. DP5N14-9]|uniref:DUF3168 domain-containing protein n=1 Tax=Halomonas sp. DP5N14-9 TaxID=2859075 RepID=UPI001C99D3C4|nr:DUF3168 domain-containing protein [Halomonas sp. DP5N14-9]MBY5942769.1 DUF3168 domain-containing protein [Halomonas sp. DP5N14-9]
MQPPIFTVCASDPEVTALLGTSPTRLYPWGEAPQGVPTPYAVWQVVTGAPENYLGSRPDIDGFTIQVDVYADTGSAATDVAEAIRDAIEDKAYVVRWGGQETDPDTGRRRISFDVDWLVPR